MLSPGTCLSNKAKENNHTSAGLSYFKVLFTYQGSDNDITYSYVNNHNNLLPKSTYHCDKQVLSCD